MFGHRCLDDNQPHRRIYAGGRADGGTSAPQELWRTRAAPVKPQKGSFYSTSWPCLFAGAPPSNRFTLGHF
jgi:hypothetical protein